MERVRNSIPDATGLVYGNGERVHLRRLRNSPGIRIRGYYRPGMLSSMLIRDRISIAVLPSVWPEAYALVVDECLSVGVPVIAFDHGAVPDRLKAWNVGGLVPLRKGASGLAESIFSCLARDGGISDAVFKQLPSPESAARQHVDLYRSLSAGAY
jgi:glycosyltransferase involved in cell wall biosynthesis